MEHGPYRVAWGRYGESVDGHRPSVCFVAEGWQEVTWVCGSLCGMKMSVAEGTRPVSQLLCPCLASHGADVGVKEMCGFPVVPEIVLFL